ncbi:MAG: adenosine deaminase [Paracoccaceae bacterium]
MTLRSLAKVELHLHLEGAAPPAFIRGLGQEKQIGLEDVFDEQGGYAFNGFAHFLRTYEAACSVLKTPMDFYRLTLAVLEQSAEQGVIYTEAFLSPDFCGGGDVGAWHEFSAAIEEAAQFAETNFGVILKGVVTCIRHFGPEQAKRTALCAAETQGSFITGFGMAGDENRGKPADFDYAFDMAREAELHLTAHAGEWGGAASVREALRDLKVARIGHGVQAIHDPELVRKLADDGITLEVCPGSNIALGVYPSWQAHPIERLREAGVKVTLSTDDPPFFHTSLCREYQCLADTFGWDEDVFTELNRNAAHAAFCDEDTRTLVLSRLEPANA